MNRSLSPLRLRGFPQLASAYTVNELGNWVGEIALAILVYDQTGSPLATAGLFLGMQFVPSLIAQGIIARLEVVGTRAVLPALYIGEAAVFVALAATVDNFSLALVIALAVLDGTLAIAARTFTRASAAAVLSPSGQLREGNAIINVGFTAAGAAGPAIAGVVVAALGVQTALLIDAGSFVAVAAVLAATGSLPQVRGEARAWVSACARGSPTCGAARAVPAAGDAGRGVRVLHAGAADRDRLREGDTRRGQLGVRRAAVRLGGRNGGRQPAVRGGGPAGVAAARSCSAARQ